jgi:hypothetical protein
MGHSIAMGCLALAFTTASIQWVIFSRKNKKLDQEASEALARGEKISKTFRYMV